MTTCLCAHEAPFVPKLYSHEDCFKLRHLAVLTCFDQFFPNAVLTCYAPFNGLFTFSEQLQVLLLLFNAQY